VRCGRRTCKMSSPHHPAAHVAKAMLDDDNASPNAHDDGMSLDSEPALDQLAAAAADPNDGNIKAFAMLQFPDAKYFMKQEKLMLGRDMDTFRAAVISDEGQQLSADLLDQLLSQALSLSSPRLGHDDPLLYHLSGYPTTAVGPVSPPVPPAQDDHQPANHGALVNDDIKMDPIPDVPDLSGPTSPLNDTVPVSLKLPDDEKGSPDCPFLGLHPAKTANSGIPSGGSISRKHALIEFNPNSGRFEILIMGRNGLFVNDEFHDVLERVQLSQADAIQIGGVRFTFHLPANAYDEDEEEPPDPNSLSGRMSMTFEDANGANVEAEIDSDESSLREHDSLLSSWDSDDLLGSRSDESLLGFDDDAEDVDPEDDDEDDDPESEGDEDAGRMKTVKIKLTLNHSRKKGRPSKPATKKSTKHVSTNKSAAAKVEKPKKGKQKAEDDSDGEQKPKPDKDDGPVHRIARDEPLTNGDGIVIPGLPVGAIIPARRKGPGRPPKDGLMSKRERQLLVKQWKEQEKAKELGLDPSDIMVDEPKKAGRPRKNSKGEEILDSLELPEKDAEPAVRKKMTRPPRSPSPQMKESDYTEEQLERPTGNYLSFIYDAIKESPDKKMNLQQIYSAIERKYPYFKFRAPSTGWQSSVRHNLGQNDVFVKLEKDGKGFFWGIKDGVSIERVRKKRSPQPSHIYPASNPYSLPQQGFGGNTPGFGQSLQGYSSSYSTATPRPPGSTASGVGIGQGSGYGSQTVVTPAGVSQLAAAGSGAPGIQRPSQDVIDTFVSVFKRSFHEKNNEFDLGMVERMVNNAVKRVLEPQTMVNVPLLGLEQGVVDAFRGCIERSQPPGRSFSLLSPRTGLTAAAGQPLIATPSPATAASAGAAAGAAAARSTTPPSPTGTTKDAAAPAAAPSPTNPSAVTGASSSGEAVASTKETSARDMSGRKRSILEVDGVEDSLQKRPNTEA
jgi:pSer/pThr/pTyr-binding forkhead associated (FHA) protein